MSTEVCLFLLLIISQEVFIHPSSSLCGRKPNCIFFNELVYTTKHYMRGVSCIENNWLPEVAPMIYDVKPAEVCCSTTPQQKLGVRIWPCVSWPTTLYYICILRHFCVALRRRSLVTKFHDIGARCFAWVREKLHFACCSVFGRKISRADDTASWESRRPHW